MSYFVMHVSGETTRDYPLDELDALLDELHTLADDEHPDVGLTHESEWSMSVFRSGKVVFQHLEENAPTHTMTSSREEILELLTALAEGRIEELRARSI